MAGPSAQLRRLGAEIRRLREAAGMTQAALGKELGRTYTSVVNWEKGRTRISKSDLAFLLAKVKAPVSTRKALEKLRDESGQRGGGWWSVYNVGDWLSPLLSFEQDAIEMHNFEPVLIPGLLQTVAYARAVHAAATYVVPKGEVDAWAEARMKRQQRLSGAKPLRIRAVIGESALRVEVGGPAVMAEQLASLLTSAKKRAVHLRVLPNSAGAHPAQSSNLAVLHFADSKTDPPIGYVDGPLCGYLVSNPGDVATLVNIFDDVQRLALSETESRALITEIMNAHLKKGDANA